MSQDPLWDSYRNYDVIKISSQNRKNSSELLKKFKIVTSNLNSNKVVRIKKFGKLSKPRVVKKIKSITKFKIFDRLARKKRIYRQIRKLQIKERLSKAKKSKVSKKNKILQHVKRKKSKIKRFRKSWILKKNKRKRASRLYKRRRFLSRSRNRRFKNNRKKSRKKLILRYREVTRARFPRKVVFMSSRKPLKLANRKLLIKLFKYTDVTHRKSNLFFRRKINKKWAIRKFIKKASRSPRIIRIINTPKGVKVIFAGISYKLNKLLLKQYINKSSVFLKMTGEEKLAYLDKLSISLEEKMKLLQM